MRLGAIPAQILVSMNAAAILPRPTFCHRPRKFRFDGPSR